MTAVPSIDPRTGEAVEVVAEETSEHEVDRICASALDAAPGLEALGRTRRAALLDALADALESRREDVVALADRETAIGPTRLNGELTRTCYQLRLFAEVLREGSYLEAAIDHAGETPMGPRPDLRRMLVPIGPVAVFGASNFPLAFSVPGGDTASALAAGCPVILKAHGSHPATSRLCFDILAGAAGEFGAPAGTLGIVFGQAAGSALVAHPAIRAVGFTGSLTGAHALLSIINSRPDPVPFYGELSSLNPLVVTQAAAAARGAEIAQGLVASFTVAGGQLCTKPGLAFVPTGEGGDRLLEAMTAELQATPAPVLLNTRIASSYRETTQQLQELPHVAVLESGEPPRGDGYEVTPLLLTVAARDLDEQVTEECFGPVAVIARYDTDAELRASLERLPSSLTASIHSEPDDPADVPRLTTLLRGKAGRLIYDGYPTGVAVSWAQHHGGPWPSTNSLHTSVGTSAIRRFLRPVTWQDAPDDVLPEELREQDPGIPRRVDGVLVPAATAAVTR